MAGIVVGKLLCASMLALASARAAVTSAFVDADEPPVAGESLAPAELQAAISSTAATATLTPVSLFAST
jgi:hypothetical protein